MILFLLGSIFVILFGVVIEPVVGLYHENTRSMISPIFGNFYNFIMALALIASIITTMSLALFVISYLLARKSSLKMSRVTLLFPLLLYTFSYALIVVSLK